MERINCPKCGTEHTKLPALVFVAPDYYEMLEDEQKEKFADLNSDFCIIRYEDDTLYFIRTVFEQKLHDACTVLEYGVWALVDEIDFKLYNENFDKEGWEATFNGFLANQIPEYDDILQTPTSIKTRSADLRPLQTLQDEADGDEAFFMDYVDGISEEEAIARVEDMLDM